jgi:GTP-binding protein
MFLGHVERCAALLHLVDGTSGTLLEDWRTIVNEIEAYGEGLADKPRVTVLNKIDAMDDEEREFLREELEAVAGPVHLMSGVSKEGLTDVLRELRSLIDEDRLRRKAEAKAEDDDSDEDTSWQP